MADLGAAEEPEDTEQNRARKRRIEQRRQSKKHTSVTTIRKGSSVLDTSDLSDFELSASDKAYYLKDEDGGVCAMITIEEDGSLHIGLLKRCKHRGTHTLQKLVDFATRNRLPIQLSDESTLEPYGIDLALLSILQTGKTWYGRFGFRNGLEAHEHVIHTYISQPYNVNSTIQERAIELAELLKGGDTSVVDELKTMCTNLSSFFRSLEIEYSRINVRGGRRRTRRARRR